MRDATATFVFVLFFIGVTILGFFCGALAAGRSHASG